jgi:TolA-binding protein
METQMQALQEEIVSMRSKDSSKGSSSENSKNSEKHADSSKGKDKAKDSKDKDKNLFDSALSNFEDKKWKEAILSFEQYREKNPKGKHAAEAAYKTGVCFQELGMIEEAKVFYQDVLAKFPQSDMAKKAQSRLKALK